MENDESKLDRILGMVHEMKPVLIDVREGQKAMDERMRASETRGTEHEVKIERIQSDIDGMGRKVRGVEARTLALGPTPPPETEPGRWRGIIEFVAAVPAVWHIVGGVVAGAAGVISAVAFVWRHHQ